MQLHLTFILFVSFGLIHAWKPTIAKPFNAALRTVSCIGISSTLFGFTMLPPSEAANLDNGQKVFTNNCAVCHAGGKNVLPFASSQTLFQSALTANGYDTKEKIIEIISNGKGAMIPYSAFLKNEDIGDAADYVLQQAKVDWK